jgi:hypothetical protein
MTQSKSPVGIMLRAAGLISAAQLDMALQEQTAYEDLRIGEIFALHGWLKQETVDFFVERWPELLNSKPPKELGYYLKAAALLDDHQLNNILQEQYQTGLRIGAIAVLKGWLKQSTLDFLLQNLAPEQVSRAPYVDKRLSPKSGNPRAKTSKEGGEEVKWIG